MPLLLGIDTGTSSTKALLCDEAGRPVATASSPHTISRPRPGWSEQDPREWWGAAVDAVRRVLASAPGGEVGAVGLSGQMHGSVFLGREALGGASGAPEPLRPAILWNDQRTGEECEEIERLAGGRRALVRMVANAALTGFTLPKILWVRRHEPGVFARAAMVLVPKDYIRLCLSGDAATDVGDASGMLLLDVARRAWSGEMLRRMGLDPALLPRVYESAEVTGRVTRWAAEQTGLREGTPVVAGSGDSQAGAVGAGVVAPGVALAAMGTSGVIYAHSDRARTSADAAGEGELPAGLYTKCDATGGAGRAGEWCITGCMLAAGGSLDWARDTLWPGATFEQVMAEAQAAPEGAGGLVFLPYLTGERSPHTDPLARGGWIGLTSRHTRGHLLRAVVEGVTFGMAQVLDLVRSVGVPVERIRLGGGGARSPFWRQLQADLYGVPVVTTNTEEGPALGAALLAGVGAGVFPGVREACEVAIRETAVIGPRPMEDPLRVVQGVYGRLYGDLRGRFAALAGADAAG
ncbi:MAG: xylulokinase [Phycisphaerales bacterium]